MKKILFLIFGLLVFFKLEAQTIKVGSLQYGSVNWELKLIKELELDKKNNFNLEIIELASKKCRSCCFARWSCRSYCYRLVLGF